MILYNVTVNVENKVREEWFQWMRDIHIPEVMGTEMFFDQKFYKLLIDEQNDTTTYSIQYFAKSIADINNYLENYAPALKQKHLEKYGTQALAFRTVMEEVE